MSPHAELSHDSELVAEGIRHTLEATAPNSVTADITSNGHSASAPNAATKSKLATLDASRLTTTITTSPKPVPDINSPEVATQKLTTDHMLTCTWTSAAGWEAPALKPYGPFSIMPTSSCLHYATQCFEGLKLYRGYDGKLRLFRPELNCKRMLGSSTRIALPGFDPEELLKLIVALCAVDGAKWLPRDQPGQFLYVRPSMIGSDSALGVQKPNEALLFVILAVFPPMDVVTGGRGMRLLASMEDMCRAWPGGFGWAKVGANYGPTLLSQGEAKARGFNQVLWLFGHNQLVTEAGAANFFVVWRTPGPHGRLQLVTAPLDDKIILDGVTRRSVLQLARDRLSGDGTRIAGADVESIEVTERQYSIGDLVDAFKEGRLVEAFTAGTAFFISGVSEIEWKDTSIKMRIGEDGCGDYARLVKGWLSGIMYGKERHEWGYVVEEKS